MKESIYRPQIKDRVRRIALSAFLSISAPSQYQSMQENIRLLPQEYATQAILPQQDEIFNSSTHEQE